MADVLGVGLVGCGWAAGSVCEAIDAIDSAVVTAAFDTIPAAAAKLAEPRNAKVHASMEDLFADPSVQLVYVGLPHRLLAPTAEAALRAGKHVLVEKPMALDSARCLALGKLAEEKGLALCVFFELRKSGLVTVARELVAGGAIGDIRAIRILTNIDKKMVYWRTPNGELNWRTRLADAGGGVVLMNTIHQLDAVLHITGVKASRVTGEIATLHAPAGVEVEDTGAGTVRLTNGGILSIVAAAHSPGAGDEDSIGIDGEHGRIEIPSPWASDASVRLFLRRDWGGHSAGQWIKVPTPKPDFYAAMVGDLVSAVRAGSPPPATARDAAAAVSIILGLYQSSREGRVVAID
jgi:UDP-N-acetyl-2-amino-2-deoxyglucuronate dehydrogenase